MIIHIYHAHPEHYGYIAGASDGIVTVTGKPVARPIHLYEVSSGFAKMQLVARQASLPNGHYMFTGLDPAKRYLIIARDHNKEYEPSVFDFVEPATDLTYQEQMALRDTWQTK